MRFKMKTCKTLEGIDCAMLNTLPGYQTCRVEGLRKKGGGDT